MKNDFLSVSLLLSAIPLPTDSINDFVRTEDLNIQKRNIDIILGEIWERNLQA